MLGNSRPFLAMLTLCLCLPAGCTYGNRPAPMDPQVEKVDIVETHWPNGKLRVRKEVIRAPEGTLVDHGLYTQWYTNGRKEYEAVFVRGKVHGVETQWHRNGQKRTEQHYDHGLRHGPRYCWDQDGKKRKEEHYVKDQPDGTWTIWDKNGRIKWQGAFDKGVPLP